MSGILEAFREGGAAMYAITLVDGCLCSASVFLLIGLALSAGRNQGLLRGVAVALLLGSFIPVCAGGVGYWLGMRNVEAAVAAASDEYRDQLTMIGEREASWNLWFGGGSSSLCLVSGLGLVVAAFVLGRGGATDPR